MKNYIRTVAFCSLVALPGTVFGQTDQHHTEETTEALSQQCATMMPMMQQMMQMMQMMGGGKGQAGMGQGTMQMPMNPQAMSEAGKAYMEAMKKMEQPMMQAVQLSDPDVAFVSAMIPHHQSAIDMAKAALQVGKDEQVKKWANQIIKAQEAEISEMQEWLKQHPQ
jgi:mannose-6-phosphate isomerase class I